MEDFDFYPQKPNLVESKQKSSLSLTVFSLVLFVLVFVLFFGSDEINFIVYLIGVLIVHELGHFVAMKYFKYENVRMLFVPLMGAFVQGKKNNFSQKQSFLVIIAGPLPGVIVGGIIMWYGSFFHTDWMLPFGALFILLNLINLVPLDPLDGGQLLKLFATRNHEMFLMVFAFISSIAIIAVGFYIPHYGYLLIIFGFFMGFRVRALQKQYQMHKELKQVNVDYATSYNLLSNKDYAKIKEVIIQNTPQLQKYIDHLSENQTDPIIASQVNSVLIAPLERDASVFFKFMILFSWIGSFLIPIGLYFVLDWPWIWSVFYM